jgi:hypothetical protein
MTTPLACSRPNLAVIQTLPIAVCPGPAAVCLRGLAAPDAGCRAAAYQALALFEAQLSAAAAPDFREKAQLRWVGLMMA